MKGGAVVLLGSALLLAAAPPLGAQPYHRAHLHRVHRAPARGHAVGGGVPYAAPWGSAVYGVSLPFVNGSCVDPYDPDPIGGTERVGAGGPGGYGPQCRAQAGVIPGTTLR